MSIRYFAWMKKNQCVDFDLRKFQEQVEIPKFSAFCYVLKENCFTIMAVQPLKRFSQFRVMKQCQVVVRVYQSRRREKTTATKKN